MAQEIKLHRGFEHENIVKFISSFQGTFSNFEQKLATFLTFFFRSKLRVHRIGNLQEKVDDGVAQAPWTVDRARSSLLHEAALRGDRIPT